MNQRTVVSLAIAAAAVCAPSTLAGFVGFETSGTVINGKFVCRVYAKFDAADFVVLSVSNLQNFASSDWNDNDFASGTWDPKFTVDANIDTYLTIGGVPGFANSTSADAGCNGPAFLQPGIPNGAGWFNSNPPNLQGKVDSSTLRTLIGQFVYLDDPTQSYSSPLNISFNQGLGTPTQFSIGTFPVHIPAPAALPLAGLALVVGRGRRRHS